MTNKDKQIWEAYAQTLNPVAKKRRKSISAKATADKAAARKSAEKAPLKLPALSAVDHLTKPAAVTLDRKREKDLRLGNVTIDAKLDLHGMTQKEALEALGHFLPRALKTGKRYLLIITGKGSDGKGVLRRNLEGWLRQSPEAKSILTVRTASPKHGGDGAFYVLLRRK
jgi:DNA-nicking Smr family endonuclease